MNILNRVLNAVSGTPTTQPAGHPPASRPLSSVAGSRLLAEESAARGPMSEGAKRMLGLRANHAPHAHTEHPGFLSAKGRAEAIKLGGGDLLKDSNRRKALHSLQDRWQSIHDELAKCGNDAPRRLWLAEQQEFARQLDADMASASSANCRKPRSKEEIEVEVFEIRRALKAKMREVFADCQPFFQQMLTEAGAAISKSSKIMDEQERATAERFGIAFEASRLLRMIRELDRNFDRTVRPGIESVPPRGFLAGFGLNL